jgi:hypothetical protein
VPEPGRNLLDFFRTLNKNCSTHSRPRELKLVSLEPSGNEDFEYFTKIYYYVCERNGKAKSCGNTIFCRPGGEGVLWDTYAHRSSENSNTSGTLCN